MCVGQVPIFEITKKTDFRNANTVALYQTAHCTPDGPVRQWPVAAESLVTPCSKSSLAGSSFLLVPAS